MAKKVLTQIKLQITAGQANPAPPVGPALGQHGLNIMDFCKAFNAATQKQNGMTIPVVITVYQDRTFTFITKTPPAAVLLRKAAGIPKGSGEPNRNKVGTVTRAQPLPRQQCLLFSLCAAEARRQRSGPHSSSGTAQGAEKPFSCCAGSVAFSVPNVP